MAETLYNRIGGAAGVTAIARDIVALHRENPVIRTRFEQSDVEALEKLVGDFLGAGTGGAEVYEGRDMRSTHRGMNIDERELVATIDDVLTALRKNGVGEQECSEILAILYSLKDEVMYQ